MMRLAAWHGWRAVAEHGWLAAPLGVLALYLYSMPLTVVFEDDGLFLMAAHFAGIPQPPGYPLYVLVAHLAALLPAGTLPLKLHVLSALFGAATCLVLALCARELGLSRPAAAGAALAFGLSPVFWSQSIIAEVYAFNACMVFLLLWISLRLGRDSGSSAGLTAGLALAFGAALTLHWPLLLLSTPALAVLLWPRRAVFAVHPLRNLLLLLAGLLPYAWMVWRANGDVFINFYGSLRSFGEFRYFLSREGFAEVDVSPTAGLADKLQFTRFLGMEALRQYTLPGGALAALGCVAQWRRWSVRAAGALTLLFLGNTLAFLALIYFDYEQLTRAAFRIYPHLAWGVMALWLALGICVAAEYASRHIAPRAAAALSRPVSRITSGLMFGAICALMLVQHGADNFRRGERAAEDYARAVLQNLPPDAELFVSGDIATHTIGYMRYVAGLRPDVEVYSLAGIVFANRLFEPLRTSARDELRLLEEHVARSTRPVCSTSALAPELAQVDSWLFSCIAPESTRPRYRAQLNADLLAYLARVLAQLEHGDPWTVFHHEQLQKRAGLLLGRAETANIADPAAADPVLVRAREGFFGTLGYVDGLTFHAAGNVTLRRAVEALNRIPELPSGASKADRARFLAMRGKVNERAGNPDAARAEFEASLALWPDARNESIAALLRLYRQAGERDALQGLRLRFPAVAESPVLLPHE